MNSIPAKALFSLLVLSVLFLCNGILLASERAEGSNKISNTIQLLLMNDNGGVCGNGILEPGEICDDGNNFINDYCENNCTTEGPLAHLAKPGRWGTPENTLLLDKLYHQDIQASYPDVNWQTLDRLYLPAGEHSSIWLGNLPDRSAERPLVITNYGGQVVVGASSASKFVVQGGSNWVLTGRFDELSATGNSSFPGHQGNSYSSSQGRYGISIQQQYKAGNGLTVRGGATDFELEYIEIGHAGFAAINIKNDNSPTDHMDNVMIHDLYIHDAEAECMYIGNTSKDPEQQHRFTNLHVFNNRAIRCGAEGLQLSHIGDGSRIFNNVFLTTALDWKDPFMAYQEGNFQIMARPGNILIENNIFIGGSNTQLSLRALGAAADNVKPGDQLHIRNNYFSHSRGTMLSYVHRYPSNLTTSFILEGNYFGEIVSQRHELLPDSSAENFYFQTKMNGDNPLIFLNNMFASGRDGYSTLTGVNGSKDNLSASGNSYGSSPAPLFQDSGFQADFDYRKLEIWSDCNKAYQQNPDNLIVTPPNSKREISYQIGDVVTHHGHFYTLTKPLTTEYQCTYDYWRPCMDSDPNNYPIELDTPNSYGVGAIVDTGEEKFYRLISPHDPYSCTPSDRYNNTRPSTDPAWERVVINGSPETDEGAEYWREFQAPKDDVRLRNDSPLQNVGLLDIARD